MIAKLRAWLSWRIWRLRTAHRCHYDYLPCSYCHGKDDQCYWCSGAGKVAKCADCEVNEKRRRYYHPAY